MNNNITRIVNEEINKLTISIINENRKDKATNSFIKSYFDEIDTFEQARNVLMNLIYKTIPDIRYIENMDAFCNVVEYFFEPDGNVEKHDGRLDSFRYVLHYAVTTTPEKLSEIEDMLAKECDDNDIDNVENEFGPVGLEYGIENNPDKVVTTPNNYKVIRIDTFGELDDWAGSIWCVANDKGFFHDYITSYGTAYVCENNNNIDWYAPELEEAEALYSEGNSFTEYLEDPRCGNFGSGKFPYDQVGLYSLFVIAWPDGRLDVYSRWNITEENGKYLTKEQLSQVLGIDAQKVCIPLKK